MSRFINSVIVSAGVTAFLLYAYYGSIDPCVMLDYERKGLLERWFEKNPEEMSASECAAELPGEWWKTAQAFWEGRPAEDK